MTVGATDPTGVDYSGSGKPADIAAIGTMYPTAYSATTISGKGNFSGTSNATPVIAGTYGRALWKARQALAGAAAASEVVSSRQATRSRAARRDARQPPWPRRPDADRWFP